MTTCAGKFCTVGPALPGLKRSKPSTDEFSILEAARLLAHGSWDEVEQGHHALEVVSLARQNGYIPLKLVISVFHVSARYMGVTTSLEVVTFNLIILVFPSRGKNKIPLVSDHVLMYTLILVPERGLLCQTS